jgi:hypothetical protein
MTFPLILSFLFIISFVFQFGFLIEDNNKINGINIPCAIWRLLLASATLFEAIHLQFIK